MTKIKQHFLTYDLFCLVLRRQLRTVFECEAANTPFQLERRGVGVY